MRVRILDYLGHPGDIGCHLNYLTYLYNVVNSTHMRDIRSMAVREGMVSGKRLVIDIQR